MSKFQKNISTTYKIESGGNMDTIANITVDQLHEYVSLMASKIAKMTVEENSVVTGTITASAGNNYTIQLKTSDSQSNARPLTNGAVYNVGDYVYLIKGAAAIKGGESPSYFIFGRVDDTNEAFANASDLERFGPTLGGVANQTEDFILDANNSYTFTVINSNKDFWTALTNERALKIEGLFTSPSDDSDFGIRLTYSYFKRDQEENLVADDTNEVFELNRAWMQGQPRNIDSLHQARVIERSRKFDDLDKLKVEVFGTGIVSNIVLTAGTLNKYLKDFSLEVKPTNKSYFYNELPEEQGEDTVRLEARLKYLDGAINSGVQYYWFVEMPEGVTAADLSNNTTSKYVALPGITKFETGVDYYIKNDEDVYDPVSDSVDSIDPEIIYYIKISSAKNDKDQVNGVGGDRWFCLNSYSDCDVVGQEEKIRIWNKSDSFIVLDKFKYLLDKNIPNIFSFDSLNKIPLKFVNKIKCVAVYEGFYINSAIFELVDYSCEQYSVSLKASETEPHNIISKEDFVEFECIVTNNNPHSGGLSAEYTWLVNDTEDAAQNITDKTICLHSGNHSPEANVYNYQVNGSATYTVVCKVEFKKNGVLIFTEQTEPVVVTSYLDSSLTIQEYYQYYISYNRDVSFTAQALKEDTAAKAWLIQDGTMTLSSWLPNLPIDNKNFLTNPNLLDDSYDKSKIWYIYYTYQKRTYAREDASGKLVDTTEWSQPVIGRVLEYREDSWKDILSGTEINQLNTFNSLTNNGKEDGVYYTDRKGYFITADTTPQSGKTYFTQEEYTPTNKNNFKLKFKTDNDHGAYYIISGDSYTAVAADALWDSNIAYYLKNEDGSYKAATADDFDIDGFMDNVNYFTYNDGYTPIPEEAAYNSEVSYFIKGIYYKQFTGTEFDENTIYYEAGEGNKLYINATYINTGTLRVGNNTNEKFYASIHNPEVRIAGFTVDTDSISNNKRYTETTDSTPDLKKNYYIYNESTKKYERQKNLTSFNQEITYYEVPSDAIYIGQDFVHYGDSFVYDVDSRELDITGIEADSLIIKNDDGSTAFYASNDDTKKPIDVPNGVKVYAQNLASISGEMGILTAGEINGGTPQQHFQYYNWQTEETINNIWDDENEYYVLQLDDMVIDESGALRRITLTAGNFNNFNKPILIPSEITKSDGNVRSITSIQGNYSLFDDPEVAKQIIGLKIAEGITSIGPGGLCAKASFLNLKTIILPSSLTEIANSALTGWGGGLLYLSQGIAKTTQIASAAFSLFSEATDTIILCEDNSPGKGWQKNWLTVSTPLKTKIEYGYYSQEERKSDIEGIFYWTDNYTRPKRFWTISTEGPQFIQSTNFSLSHRGDIIANNGTFSGKLQGATGSFSGDLIAKKGQIANFTIDEKQLSTKNLSLSDDGINFLSPQASLKLASTSLSSENNKVTLNINEDIFEITGKTTALIFQSDSPENKSYPLSLKIESGYLNADGNRFEDYQFNDGWGLAMPAYKLTLTTSSTEDWLIYPYIVNISFTATYTHQGSTQVLKEGTLAFKFNSKNTKTVSVYTPTLTNLANLTLNIFSIDSSSAASYSVPFSPKTSKGTLSISSYHTLLQKYPGATIRCQADFLPTESATGPQSSGSMGWNLGDKKAWWRDAYIREHPTEGSDVNLKNNIVGLHNQIILNDFFDLLQPVSYQWIDGTSGRTHFGLIAQDVKQALLEAGLTTQDVAAYCEWKKEDGSIGCGLRYGEFIALCIDQIQKLKKEVSSLKEELKEIKGE